MVAPELAVEAAQGAKLTAATLLGVPEHTDIAVPPAPSITLVAELVAGQADPVTEVVLLDADRAEIVRAVQTAFGTDHAELADCAHEPREADCAVLAVVASHAVRGLAGLALEECVSARWGQEQVTVAGEAVGLVAVNAARWTGRADSLAVGEVALGAESAEGRGETGDASF
jgi:hypothetical protein